MNNGQTTATLSLEGLGLPELELPTLPVEEPTAQDPATEPSNETSEEGTDTATEPTEEPNEPATTDPVIENGEASENPFGELFTALNYTGEIKNIADLADLVKVATEVRASHEQQLAQYADPTIQAAAEFIRTTGGTLEDFLSVPQPTNIFTDAVFEDDQTTEAEEFLTAIMTDAGVPEIGIPSVIEKLKSEGKLIETGNLHLEKERVKEEARNAQILADNQAEHDKQVKFQTEFFAAVKDTFEKPLQGVTASKQLVEEAKAMSLPDAGGKVGIIDVINNLDAKQASLLHIAALAIKSGKNFSYTPTKAVQKNPTPNIVQSILKGGQSGKGGELEFSDPALLFSGK